MQGVLEHISHDRRGHSTFQALNKLALCIVRVCTFVLEAPPSTYVLSVHCVSGPMLRDIISSTLHGNSMIWVHPAFIGEETESWSD